MAWKFVFRLKAYVSYFRYKGRCEGDLMYMGEVDLLTIRAGCREVV